MENKLILKKKIWAGLKCVLPIVMYFMAAGCGNTTTTNPLKGWKGICQIPDATLDSMKGLTNSGTLTRRELPVSLVPKAIMDDCQQFIKEMPVHKDRFGDLSERTLIQSISFLKDNTGQHALLIMVPVDGTFLWYIIIYDRNDRRVKVTKYVAGHYSS